MKSLESRIERLEGMANSRSRKEAVSEEEFFDFANEIVEEFYPGHDWNKLSLNERWRIWTRPPVSNPQDDPEKRLAREVRDLVLYEIRQEKKRRKAGTG
jgi:hypothetical protein